MIDILEAVIFDMDGVIVDTEPGYFDAINEYLADFHISVSRKFNERLLGISYSRIWELVSEEYGIRGISGEEFLEGMERKRKERISREGYIPVQGTIELIRELYMAGIKMAIASSSPRVEIEEVMDAVNVRQYFQAVVSAGDECEKGKPDPEVFLKAAGKLDVKPGNCLVIEDAAPGTAAAKNAGMYVIGYKTSFGNQEFKEADFVVTSMRDVDLMLCRKIAGQ